MSGHVKRWTVWGEVFKKPEYSSCDSTIAEW